MANDATELAKTFLLQDPDEILVKKMITNVLGEYTKQVEIIEEVEARLKKLSKGRRVNYSLNSIEREYDNVFIISFKGKEVKFSLPREDIW